MWIIDFRLGDESSPRRRFIEAPFAICSGKGQTGARRQSPRDLSRALVAARRATPGDVGGADASRSRHGRARPRKAGYDGGAPARVTSRLPRSQNIAYSCGCQHQSASTVSIIAIARDDDTTFGILHSRFHEAWSLRLGTWLGVGNDPRYTPTTTFETFPFPEGLTPNIPGGGLRRRPARPAHRRGRQKARRPAPRLAQPARSRRHRSRDNPDRRARRSAAPLSRPHPAKKRRSRGQAQGAHAHQSLQRAPALARRRARGARPRRRRGLRLARGHFNRGRPCSPARAQSRASARPRVAATWLLGQAVSFFLFHPKPLIKLNLSTASPGLRPTKSWLVGNSFVDFPAWRSGLFSEDRGWRPGGGPRTWLSEIEPAIFFV